jgi:hypothetical protein
MKLRIRGNSLRLRLTQTEVAELVYAGRLENRTQLGQDPALAFVFRLQLSPFRLAPGVEYGGGRITVSLPEGQARSWAQEDEVGIYSEEPWGLKLSVEKDFQCLDQRPNEDDSDAFDRALFAATGITTDD